MTMFIDINSSLEESKVDNVRNNNGLTTVYCAVIDIATVDEIDFSQFTINDIDEAYEDIFDAYIDQDDDGFIQLDPNHPFTRLLALQYKMAALERTEKTHVPSSFRFL